jgi:glutathione S-transferase
MTDFILHHYPNSPFSEKIRLIFGAKKLAWKSVIIPAIMPKPDVLALTGGYRKTPILQIGADIYCDSALIAKKIDELAPSPPLYPPKQAASVLALSQWADTFLFQVAVSHVFKPANLAHMFGNSPETLEAFTKDRAAMRTNATTRRMSSLEAMAAIQTFLTDFDRQLAAGSPFAAGDALSVADFSVYHCLWFMRRAPSAAILIDPFTNVIAWMQRMNDYGQGRYTEISSADAVSLAQHSKPQSVAHPQDAGAIRVGDAVEVLPTDYGIDPTPGTLVNCTLNEIAIRRIDARATDVVVHFPRVHYELRKAAS